MSVVYRDAGHDLKRNSFQSAWGTVHLKSAQTPIRAIRGALILALAVIFSALSQVATAAVYITEVTNQGIPCFRIETPTATYLYDKAGAGFVSIVDRAGREWIGFRPLGSAVPDGRYGWYRGLPNMAVDQFGHPGYEGATTKTADPKGVPLETASVRSTNGDWDVSWDFFSTFARLTVHSTEGGFWFLYEGTPGGALDEADMCWRSDGFASSCADAWEGDVVNTSGMAAGTEWVAFADAEAERALVLIHPDDAIADTYFPLKAMTVFGFGRTTEPPLLTRVLRRLGLLPQYIGLLERLPEELVVSFAEGTDFRSIARHADRIATMALRPKEKPD